jgi:hypothetical protein
MTSSVEAGATIPSLGIEAMIACMGERGGIPAMKARVRTKAQTVKLNRVSRNTPKPAIFINLTRTHGK